MLSIAKQTAIRFYSSSSRRLYGAAATASKVSWSYASVAKESQLGMSKRKPDRHNGGSFKRQKKVPAPNRFEGSHEEVLIRDIENLLSSSKFTSDGAEAIAAKEDFQIPGKFEKIEVRISELSSTGDAIGFQGDSKEHVFVVPFALPGELVKAKVIRTETKHKYSVTDFLEVLESSPRRDTSLIKCQYFAKCSGCQFQMTPYEDQLRHKRTIIEKAYKNFSGLSADILPEVGDTIGSPLQFGYRTKLTPHFDGPPGVGFKNKDKQTFKEKPPFGFMQKNTRWTIDIEDCPIGTPAVTTGLKRERDRLSREYSNYHRGATILLRESTKRTPKHDVKETSELENFEDIKTCITDSNATSTEYIDDFIFTNPAGSFFQNNNSILPVFTQYIRDRIKIGKDEESQQGVSKPLNYLIDAYCGSGLFTVTLSSLFKSSAGIDIAEGSIEYASKNAKLNRVLNAKFTAATASRLFKSITFVPEETLVVIDPPRKGCDEDFIQQLLQFAPRKVVYVSCNVHTQARDVGILVNGIEGQSTRYKIESLRGFDFFPQTGHVESVAFLTKQP